VSNDLDFNGLRYNYAKVNQPILEAFPDLQKLNGIDKLGVKYNGVDREAILRYMLLMYDSGSPVNEPDLMGRKSMCAIEAKIPQDRHGKFSPAMEKMIMMEDPVFNDIVISFVNSFHSATYSKLVAYKQHYDTLLRSMMTGVNMKLVKLDDIDMLEQSINEMQSRLLRDNSPNLVEALYEKIATDQLLLRPEDIAEKLENGEEPVDVKPYGESYSNTKKYKWKGTKHS